MSTGQLKPLLWQKYDKQDDDDGEEDQHCISFDFPNASKFSSSVAFVAAGSVAAYCSLLIRSYGFLEDVCMYIHTCHNLLQEDYGVVYDDFMNDD